MAREAQKGRIVCGISDLANKRRTARSVSALALQPLLRIGQRWMGWLRFPRKTWRRLKGVRMDTATRTLIVGVFDDRNEAEMAVDELEHSGFTKDDVGFALRGND